MNVFDLQAKLGLNTSEYEAGLDKAKQGSSTFASVLKANLVTKGIELVSKGLVKASREMVAFAKASVQTGAQFDEAMSQVAATMGVTVDEIGELRDFAQEMGAKTAFSATQAAEALNYMALAGYDAETSMKMLPNVLNLAAAGGFELARASDMVTDAQSALGLTLKETNTMVDQMAAASSKSNTSVEQLGDAILTIGATARGVAGGTQELATVLGVLADNGIKGAEGGTHLRNAILSLQTPTKDGTEALAQLNMTYEDMYDSAGNLRSLPEIFQQMSTAMEGMNQQQKDAIVSGLFNKTDLASINALLGTSADRWRELSVAIGDSAGAAEKMAATQLDNLNGDLTLMQSALEGVKIQFSDGITPAIRNVVQTLTKALSKRSTQKYLNDLGKKLGEVVKTLTGKVMTALPKVLSLFEDGGKKVQVFAGAIGGLALTLTALSSPIGAAKVAFTAFAAVMGTVALTAETTRNQYGKLTSAQRDNIDAAKDAVEAYHELKDSRDDTIRGIEQETQQTKDLWTELQSLAGADGTVAEKDREHAQVLINQLNDALGTELELVGDQIVGYTDLADAIDKMLEKKKAESMYAAVSENAEQAKKNLEGVQTALYDQGIEVDNLKSALDFYDQKLEEVRNSETMDIASKQQQIDMYERQKATLQAQVDAAESDYQRLADAEREAYADMALADEAYKLLMEGNYAEVAELIANDTTNRLKHRVEVGNISDQEIQDLERTAGIAKAALERYQQELQAGSEGYTQEEYDAMAQHVADLEELLTQAKEQIAETGSDSGTEYVSGIEESSGDAAGAAEEVSGSALSVAWSKISDFWSAGAAAGSAWSEGYAANAHASTGGRGYAIGLDYVPSNNFPAQLHRGEAVLTAREADEWRRGESGRAANAQPIQLTVETPVEMDGQVVAKKIYKFLLNEGEYHGGSLINA